MTPVAIALLALGGLASVAGWVWLLVVAFRESPMWGIGLLLAPSLVGWVFAGTHLDKAAVPFALHFFGGVLALLALWFGPGAGLLGIRDSGSPLMPDQQQLDELQERLGDTGPGMLVIETG